MSDARILPALEGLPQMRALAAEAKKAAAEAATTELQKAYEEIARSWEHLLMEIENFGIAQGKG
jgi:hypothetical protein